MGMNVGFNIGYEMGLRLKVGFNVGFNIGLNMGFKLGTAGPYCICIWFRLVSTACWSCLSLSDPGPVGFCADK